MDFDKIKEAVEKLAKDDSFQKDLKQNPIKAIEKELGVNLPDEQVKEVVSYLKDKFDDDFFDGLKDKAGDIIEQVEKSGVADSVIDKVKGFFHKE